MDTNGPSRAWEEALGEVSGFGGNYENMCRSMVLAGFRWIDENPFTAPVFFESTNACGRIEQANPSAKRLLNAILSVEVADINGERTTAAKTASPAMIQSVLNHCMYYFHHGWDGWRARMINRPKEETIHGTH